MKQDPPHQGRTDAAGIVVSALRGGSGKTILSIGITAALKNLGKSVAPFKKGPDYIDAGWLALAAGRPCYNLDTYLVDADRIVSSYNTHSQDCDLAVIEGNRGLYDSIDTEGVTSTAELAKLLNLPVILCIDCTKATRTMAAVVSGCEMFDPEVDIRGVVLNRVAGIRHENNIRKNIEQHCGIQVVGAIPKLKGQKFPERHMGLVPTPEHDWAADSIKTAADMAAEYIDLPAVLQWIDSDPRSSTGVAGRSETITVSETPETQSASSDNSGSPIIGIARDSAFQFYYPENIDALEAAGAIVVFTSPLDEAEPPPMDAMYIGGGFPETHAQQLEDNRTYRASINRLAQEGMPVYAECGGLMYLGEALKYQDRTYGMTGVFPIVFGFSKRPMGHGYTLASVVGENPYYPLGTEFRGHEFHYSSVLSYGGSSKDLVFTMNRGTGFMDGKDGVCFKNVLATYTHVHALGIPGWAKALVDNAKGYRQRSGK